jgi:hypothetical protein
LFALERDSLDPVTANTLLTRGDVIDGDICALAAALP